MAIAFLVLHVVAFLYVASMLWIAVALRSFFQLLLARTAFSGFHLPWVVLPVGLAMVAALAIVETRHSLSRLRQRQSEPDVALRVRAMLVAVLACVVVNVVFLSTAETFAGPFRVRFPLNSWMSVAFAYGGYALWSVLLPRARRSITARIRRGMDVVVMNAAIALVFAEIALRALAMVWSSPLLVTEVSSSQIRRDANRQPEGAVWFGFPMNSGGHYDTEFVRRSANANRIVVSIGDSFSYGSVPHAYHFTTVAERALRGIDVYNMGYSGIGVGDYLYLLQHEALPMQPDLVLINIFVGNDVTDRPISPGPSRWYDAESYLLAIVWYRVQAMRRADMKDVGRGESVEGVGRDLIAQYPWLTNPLVEPPSLTKEVFLDIQGRSADAICVQREELYPPFFETMEQIIRAAGSVPLAFVLIPEEYQVEDSIWQEVTSRSNQPLDRELAQRTIGAWLTARGLPVLDLLPVMRSVPPMDDGRRHVYHLHDMHFNARGNHVAGIAMARFADSLLSQPAVLH